VFAVKPFLLAVDGLIIAGVAIVALPLLALAWVLSAPAKWDEFIPKES